MGLADKLGMGRSSTFVATVTVHELAQVPLVNAKFRVKWKFKGATTSSHLADGDGDDRASSSKGFLHPRSALNPGAPPPRARSASPSEARDSTDDSSSSARRAYSPPNSPPMSPADMRTPNPNRTPSGTHSSTFAFTSPFSANSEQIYAPNQNIIGHTTSHTSTPEDSPTAHGRRRGGGDLTYMPPAAPPQNRTESKGATTFIPLRNHTATFSREIHCPVSIPLRSLSGGRYQLQPSPVKLSIKQEVVGDDGKKEETKTGQVLLDLSQFVGNGKGEGLPRRYLLRECKTNATLKVTVKMEFISGEAHFVAPPLKTGQVAANSSAASGLGSSSSSIANRSTTSLGSRTKQPIPAGRNSSSTSMSRTNSSSSLSTQSLPSSTSGSAPGGKNGWRPNMASSYSSSPSPTLLGGASGDIDRNATDLIETLFNRPPRQGSWTTLPTDPSTSNQNSQAQLGAGDALVFSVGRGKRSAASSSAVPLAERNGKGKGKEHHGWGFRSHHSTSSAPPTQPPSRPTSALSFRAPTPAAANGAERPPRQPRRPSISGQSVASSKNLSVRWGDDKAGASAPPLPTQRSTSSSASSLLGGKNGGLNGKTGILRSESSESSLDGDEAGEQSTARSTPRPLSGLARADSGASKVSVVARSTKSTSSNGKGGIEWAKSWG